jgi:uncharacterized protein (UPF0332 family)
MSLPRDLLNAAIDLYRVRLETQATLRRSVSTAYYALFHLIIETACENWPESQRSRVARQFEHKRMKDVSAAIADRRPAVPSPAQAGLIVVANTFVQLQQNRHTADYILSAELTSEEVALDILLVEDAFKIWSDIKGEQVVHDYLFSLLFKERP